MTNIAHLGESHDQHRTLLESRDEYCTLFESGQTQWPYFASHLLNDTFSGFVDALDLVGGTKWLHLPRFNDYLSGSDNLLRFA